MWSADAPSATWGSAAYLVVSYEPWYGTPQRDVSMVRFDQAALAAAVGGQELVRATLQLHVINTGWNDPPSTLAVRRMLVPWDEATAGWTCAAASPPGNCLPDRSWHLEPGPYAAYSGTGHSFDFYPLPPDGNHRVDVTTDVAEMLRGTMPNHGWAIVRALDTLFTYGNQLASREFGEYEYSPKLELLLAAPVVTAPALDPTTATAFDDAVWHVATAPTQGAATLTAQANRHRLAVVRGKVSLPNGAPAAGVRVEVLGHAEYGYNLTDAQGVFDLAVLGGENLTVRYTLAGHLEVQRVVSVPWNDYRWADDVTLTATPGEATRVYPSGGGTALTSNASGVQVVRSTTAGACPGTDGPGRPVTVLLPAGTSACNGASALTSFSLGMAEYTTGGTSVAMPGALPPASGYTYATEFVVREGGAVVPSVHFVAGTTCSGAGTSARPVWAFIPNFLNVAVGAVVPVGAYDRALGQWTPEANGRVVRMLPSGGSDVVVDDDRDNAANISSTFSAAEREALRAAFFPAGCAASELTLWMLPMSHFSPGDFNFARGLAGGGGAGGGGPGLGYGGGGGGGGGGAGTGNGGLTGGNPAPCGSTATGSIIQCENRVVGEALAVAGTPFTLHYSTDRAPGMRAAQRITIPLVDPRLVGAPAEVLPSRVRVEIQVAGQRVQRSWAWSELNPSFVYTYDWDGRDGAGRTVQGSQRALVRLGYEYAAPYASTGGGGGAMDFGAFGDTALPTDSPGGPSTTPVGGREALTIWSERTVVLGVWDARAQGIGGWTLDVHHALDPLSRTVYLGNGQRMDARSIGQAIDTIAGTGEPCMSPGPGNDGEGGPATAANLCMSEGPNGVTIDARGNVFIAAGHRIRRVDAATGVITSLPELEGDAGTNAVGLAFGPDGALYVISADDLNYRAVLRIVLDALGAQVSRERIAGNWELPTVAVRAGVGPTTPVRPIAMAFAPDGTLYFTEYSGSQALSRVRRLTRQVRADGTSGWHVDTVVGGAVRDGFPPSSQSIASATFRPLAGIVVMPDGSLLVAETTSPGYLLRISPTTQVTVFAGTTTAPAAGTALTTANVYLRTPYSLAYDRVGNLLVSYAGNDSMGNGGTIISIAPDGVVTTVAGGSVECTAGVCGDRGLAAQSTLANFPMLAVAPEGTVYVGQQGIRKVRRLYLPVPESLRREAPGVTAFIVPSADASRFYHFDHRGRHLRTLDASTGVELFSFEYDTAGRLERVNAPFDRDLVLTRSTASGAPEVTLTASDGQATRVRLDSTDWSGWASRITDPNGLAWQFTYVDSRGLLATARNPRGGLSRMTYDPIGLLESDTDAAWRRVTLAPLAGGGVRMTTSATETTSTALDFARSMSLLGGEVRTFQRRSTAGVPLSYPDRLVVGPAVVSGTTVPAGTARQESSDGTVASSRTGTETGPTAAWARASGTRRRSSWRRRWTRRGPPAPSA